MKKREIVKEYVGRIKKFLNKAMLLCTLVLAIPVDENSAVRTKSDIFLKRKSETHLKEIVFSFNYHELRSIFYF